MFLIDTNVLTEALKQAPAPQVVRWLNRAFTDSAISSVTAFELTAGATRLPAGQRRDAMENAIARLVRRFGPRTYSFDMAAAQSSTRLINLARTLGLGLHQLPTKTADLQIAGIAEAYGLTLATRNLRDFTGLGLSLFNPWDQA